MKKVAFLITIIALTITAKAQNATAPEMLDFVTRVLSKEISGSYLGEQGKVAESDGFTIVTNELNLPSYSDFSLVSSWVDLYLTDEYSDIHVAEPWSKPSNGYDYLTMYYVIDDYEELFTLTYYPEFDILTLGFIK